MNGAHCDIVYFAEASVSPARLLEAQLAQCESASLRRLMLEGSSRLEAIYGAGGFCGHPAALAALVREAALACGIVPSGDCAKMLDRFFDRLNRALFIEQTWSWLADSGLRVRGPADDQPALLDGGGDDREPADSLHDSAIQLAAGPYGAVSPRVLDDVARGGFFLFRFCPADVIERLYPPICEFCLDRGISNNAQLAARATPGIRRLLEFADRTLGMDVLREWKNFVPHVLACYSHGRARAAAAIWSAYPTLTFGTRDELLALCRKYLDDITSRRRIAQTMRQELLDRRPQVELMLPNRAMPAALAA